jgi:antitoxin component YwqK of YwqJK toxin-antitoxin module
MSDEPQPTKPKAARLRPQFSMQTMLIGMLVAALVCAWLLTPRLKETTLGGGALKIRAQWTPARPAVNMTSPVDDGEAFARGRWIMYDSLGHKLADGQLREGKAAGNWRYFNLDQREVQAAFVRHGVLDGKWTARHANGKLRQEVLLAQPEVHWHPQIITQDKSLTPPPFDDTGPLVQAPQRTGPTHETWEDGSPRIVGQFARDRRDGKWTWYDRSGGKVLEGNYEQGCKQGPWRRWERPGQEPTVEHYVHGQRVDDLDALLARLSADLFSDELRRQVRAAHGLRSLGRAGVPPLQAALQDANTDQQLLALRTLQHLGPLAAAAADDLEATAKDAPARVRFRALVALAEIDPQRASDAFEQMLVAATDEEAERREPVVQCLTRAGPVGLQQLVAALNGNQPEIRLVAFEVVRRMHEDRTRRSPGKGDPRVDLETLQEVMCCLIHHFDEEIRLRVERDRLWLPR